VAVENEGIDQTDEAGEVGVGGKNKFLRLPYALAKERGLDTTGLTPSQVWDLLAGMGVDPKAEMNKLADELGNGIDVLSEQERAEYELGKREPKEYLAEKLRAERVEYDQDPNMPDGIYNGTDSALVTKNLQRLGELIDKYPVNGNLAIIGVSQLDGIASYSGYHSLSNRFQKRKPTIKINRERYKSSSDLLSGETHSNENSKGFSARCDENKREVYTITHEYGHHIFANIRQSIFSSNSKLQNELDNITGGYYSSSQLKKRYDKFSQDLDQIIINDILTEYKKIDPNYKTFAKGLPFISYYGNGFNERTNKINVDNAEWLAETFAELNCTLSPRPLCRAMQNYLKNKGAMK